MPELVRFGMAKMKTRSTSTRANTNPLTASTIERWLRGRADRTGLTPRSIPSVKRQYRVVVAKPGLDGHDRGVKVIARALRDAGFEVIYTGLFQTPEQVAEAALQEDADAVGLSVLSGAHMTLFPRVMEELDRRGLDDVLVFGGGIVPGADIATLEGQGVAAIFTPGSADRRDHGLARRGARRARGRRLTDGRFRRQFRPE